MEKYFLGLQLFSSLNQAYIFSFRETNICIIFSSCLLLVFDIQGNWMPWVVDGGQNRFVTVLLNRRFIIVSSVLSLIKALQCLKCPTCHNYVSTSIWNTGLEIVDLPYVFWVRVRVRFIYELTNQNSFWTRYIFSQSESSMVNLSTTIIIFCRQGTTFPW